MMTALFTEMKKIADNDMIEDDLTAFAVRYCGQKT